MFEIRPIHLKAACEFVGQYHRHSCCKAVRDAAFHLPLSCGDLRKSQVVVSRYFYRIVYFFADAFSGV